MFVTGICKKCCSRVIFNIEDKTKEVVEEWLKQRDFGHCAVGFHVELGKMSDYYILDWDNLFETEDQAREFNKAVEETCKDNTATMEERKISNG